ncbi:MAG: hypothetical protein U0670_23420 [Anaerolineae bacterium]
MAVTATELGQEQDISMDIENSGGRKAQGSIYETGLHIAIAPRCQKHTSGFAPLVGVPPMLLGRWSIPLGRVCLPSTR